MTTNDQIREQAKELEPCPKCKSTNLLLRDIGGWELDCLGCELSLVLADDPSREGLVAAWNTRVQQGQASVVSEGGFRAWWLKWRTSEVPADDDHTSLHDAAKAGWAAGAQAERERIHWAVKEIQREITKPSGTFVHLDDVLQAIGKRE